MNLARYRAAGRSPLSLGIRPDGLVEFFEGRAPMGQASRDRLTDQLVSKGLVRPNRLHRLTVQRETRVLLEVDGEPVKLLRGEVVTTARVGSSGTAESVGLRRALTLAEAEELEAITSPDPSVRWVQACAYSAVFLFSSTVMLVAFRPRTFWPAALAVVTVWLLTLLWGRQRARQSDRAQRARIIADRSGGLVWVADAWLLPATDIVWERDGAPGRERLERGGLAGEKHYEPRLQTF